MLFKNPNQFKKEKRMNLKFARLSMTTLLVLAVILALAMAFGGTAKPVYADIYNGCPPDKFSTSAVSNRVGVHVDVSGNDATYYFDSFVTEGSGGIPGLIEYCVYSDIQPVSVTTVAVGADGTAWVDPPGFNNFSFSRPLGDPTNIPYDGISHEMGTATYNAGIPNGYDTIVLHINDPAECGRLYSDNPLTCYVLPGTPPAGAQDLEVSKTAEPSYTRTYNWDITKGVAAPKVVKQFGGTATFNYTVNAWQTGFTDSDWAVNGTITVYNPNDFDVTGVNITDDGCTVTDGTELTVPAGGYVYPTYTCTFSTQPEYGVTMINTATAIWPNIGSPNTSATGSADYTFVDPTTLVNDTVTITDTFNGVTTTLGTLTATNAEPWASATYTYSNTVAVPTWNCKSYYNTAVIVETGQSATQKVKVCGPVKTGALTMGFWQNKNGQAIIKGEASTGVCPSGVWLQQFAPFEDLGATATCAQVGTYVTNVIKAANASGSSMNAMLKGQMLATALDVYFSDPALGGNKINAPKPIGGVKIDLTKICKDLTCTSFENSSSVFGGTPKTVYQMLVYAASQFNSGIWYGNVKSVQELTKDAFDAINNEKVFAGW
jgi:hypothetical protein